MTMTATETLTSEEDGQQFILYQAIKGFDPFPATNRLKVIFDGVIAQIEKDRKNWRYVTMSTRIPVNLVVDMHDGTVIEASWEGYIDDDIVDFEYQDDLGTVVPDDVMEQATDIASSGGWPAITNY